MNHWMFEQVNHFAAATPWLHGIARAYADYGVIVFAALLLAGWWIGRRSGEVRRVAAAIAAGGATLIAVAVNQPIVHTPVCSTPWQEPGCASCSPLLHTHGCHEPAH